MKAQQTTENLKTLFFNLWRMYSNATESAKELIFEEIQRLENIYADQIDTIYFS